MGVEQHGGKKILTSAPPRLVIPDDQCIVILDTNVARALAYGTEVPHWVNTFALMAEQGYSFSIGDATFAELIAQRNEGRITDTGYAQMTFALEKFINKKIPVLPGKKDVVRMIGAKPSDPNWSEEDVFRLAQAAWEKLRLASIENDQTASELLQEERNDWVEIFKVMDAVWESSDKTPELHETEHEQLQIALNSADHGECVVPSMAVRADLQTRLLWRQFVRCKKAIGPYTPESAKKANDGIDFDFYRYLALPALVVSEDTGFFSRLDNITSFQKQWFYKPQGLADAWARGDRPLPEWPA